MLSRKASLTLVVALTASACAAAPTPVEQAMVSEIETTHQIIPAGRVERDAANKTDLLTQATFWGREYDKNPNDHEAAVRFSEVLRNIGNPGRSSEVSSQALNLWPEDVDLTKTFARASLETGRPEAAVGALARVEAKAPNDWKLMTIIGVTFDQLGRHADAQAYYLRALDISPDNPKIMSNIGLSYALAGDPRRAEETLRMAAALPNADTRVYQNLALVLGVQGKFDEAKGAFSEHTPESLIEANHTYFRTLLSPGRSWDQLRGTTN